MLSDTVYTSARQLRRRYIVALTLIALLILAAQALMQFLIADQVHDSRVVNIAGRQRMLSQRITKLGFYLAQASTLEDNARLRTELGEALALWHRSHDGLLNGDKELGLPGQNSPEVLALFAEIDPHFSAVAEAAEKIAAMPMGDPALSVAIARIRTHERDFLKGMDAIVFQYDKEANAKVENARRLELILAGVTLVVLLFEAIFIFAPASRRIECDIRELAEKEGDMDRLFSVSPSALLLIDTGSLAILHANERASALFGDPVNILKHANLRKYVGQEGGVNHFFLGKVRGGEALNEYDTVLIGAHGTLIDALVSVRTIRFARGEVLVLGITDITELKKAQSTLEHQASFDDMTGLLNRRTGLSLLGKEMARRRRDGSLMSVCYMDVDGLKTVNDQLGHAAGDRLIRTVARVLQEHIRGGDSAVRLGGDEILLILHDCSDVEAQRLLERVQGRLTEVEMAENMGFPLAFSHGIVRFDPQRHATPDDLISEADQRMYLVKEIHKSSPSPLSSAFHADDMH